LNKDEIIALLIDNNVITPADLLKSKIVQKEPAVVKHKVNQGRYENLKGIRTNPKRLKYSTHKRVKPAFLLPRLRHDVRLELIPIN